MKNNDTIIALSTPPGVSATGVLRMSGEHAVEIAEKAFSKPLKNVPGNTMVYGTIKKEGEPLDDVVLGLFRAPKSYTRENVVEISFHGSPYVLEEALKLFVSLGARLAEPGEFTQRAYLNGALDLAQAEAVADLIASQSEAAHTLALKQLRGGVSREVETLREQLLQFASLIELELDFAEEDVEFADRKKFLELIDTILTLTGNLADTFRLGNAIRNGISTVIAGRPNAGKSTLLNALLKEDRAIVSDIPGTTRDTIEENLTIGGIVFRLIDTAGIREALDAIEAIGVNRTLEKIAQASILLYVYDAFEVSPAEAEADVAQLRRSGLEVVIIANKADKWVAMHDPQKQQFPDSLPQDHLFISGREETAAQLIRDHLLRTAIGQNISREQTVISNVRHYEALRKASDSLKQVQQGLHTGLHTDLIAIDIRAAIYHLGEITGKITTDEVLGNIFSKFCIGK